MAQICNINEIGELIHCGLAYTGRYQFLHPIIIMPPPNLNLFCPKKLPTHFLFQQRMYHFNDGQSVINKEVFLFFRIGFSFRYCIICGMPKTMHFLPIAFYYIIRNIIKTNLGIIWCNKLILNKNQK